MQEKLYSLIEKIGHPRVCVVGDLMLDTYVWGQVNRVSPEGPIPVLHVDRKEHRPGGAGSVTAMLRALEAEVTCIGAVGDDLTADELREELENIGADASGLVTCHDRPTIRKTRYLGYVHSAGRGIQQIVRVDEEMTDPLPGKVAEEAFKRVEKELQTADLLLIQDMAKGFFSLELLQRMIEAAREVDCPVVVDPDRHKDYAGYRHATCLLPNRQEAENATGFQLREEEDYRNATRKLVGEYDLETAVVTLDREGMFYATSDGEENHVATNPRAVLDVTGAGDMVAAMMALALSGGAGVHEAVSLANIAAGLEVSRQGASPVSRAELCAEIQAGFSPAQKKIKSRMELERILSERRKHGETVAFTNGVFDLLHLGHVELIRFASQQADCLVVGMNSDRSVRELKGPSRPINTEDIRAQTMASLPHVDYVVVFDEVSVLPLIKELQPDVLVKGGDYDESGVVGYDFVTSYGGQVKLAPQVEGLSTTEIIRRITEGEQ